MAPVSGKHFRVTSSAFVMAWSTFLRTGAGRVSEPIFYDRHGAACPLLPGCGRGIGGTTAIAEMPGKPGGADHGFNQLTGLGHMFMSASGLTECASESL
jgi:hypothetical protein